MILAKKMSKIDFERWIVVSFYLDFERVGGFHMKGT
jgi:hypothetical protein